MLRIILHDLKESWRGVANIEFSIDAQETEPQLVRILAPNEAVVAISMEVKIGEASGMMNVGIPSIIIKMLRQKFDQQWTVRRSQSSEADQKRILRLVKPARLQLDARLEGPTLNVSDLMRLEAGDVLQFDHPVDLPLRCTVNGKLKYEGQVVEVGQKRGFLIRALSGGARARLKRGLQPAQEAVEAFRIHLRFVLEPQHGHAAGAHEFVDALQPAAAVGTDKQMLLDNGSGAFPQLAHGILLEDSR